MINDSLHQSVNQKLKQIDEVAELREKLRETERKANELSVKIKNITKTKYKEQNKKIKEKIIDFCKQKGFQVHEINEVSHLSYKNVLEFTVNLNDDTRYISRRENGKKNLGFSVRYEIKAASSPPDGDGVYSSETEGLIDMTRRSEESIQLSTELIQRLPSIGVDMKLEYDDHRVRIVQEIEQIIEAMFE